MCDSGTLQPGGCTIFWEDLVTNNLMTLSAKVLVSLKNLRMWARVAGGFARAHAWTGFYLGIWMGTGFCPGPIWIMRFCQGIRMGKMWAKLNKASKILSRWAHGWGFTRAHGWGFARAHGVLPGHLDTGKTPSMCPSR